MVQAQTVEAIFRANVKPFIDGLNQAKKATEQFQKQTSLIDGVGNSLVSVGKGLTTGVTLPILGIATAAIKVGNEFEAQMSRVQAIAGATSDQLKAMTDQAVELGATTAFSASEVAEGMENMASAGFTVEEIMASMAGVLDLAAVSGKDVGLASEAVATTLRQFGLEADQAGHLANIFARAAADTNAETVDMAEALKYAAPIANTLGLTVEETAAAVGLLADSGIKGSQAGTTLRSAFTRLAKPTDAAAELMEELGVNAFDADGKMRPMGDVIADLQKAMSGMTSEQKTSAAAILFGQQAMSGMLALIERGPEDFDALTDSLRNSEGAAQEMADTILDNVAGSIEEMGGAIETAAINIQQLLAPVIKDIIERITELINKFNLLTDEQQANILKWAAIAAAIGPFLIVFGKIFLVVSKVVGIFGTIGAAIGKAVTVFKAGSGAFAALKAGMAVISGPVGWITALILALVAAGIALWQNWDTVKDKASQLKDWVSKTWTTVSEATSKFFSDLVESVSKWWSDMVESVKTFFTNSKQNIVDGYNNMKQSAIDGMKSMYDSVKEWWNNLVTSAVDGVTNMYQSVVTWWENLVQSAKDIFNSVKETVSNVWQETVGTVVGFATELYNRLQERFWYIFDAISAVWENIKTAAGAAWELIKIIVITPILALLQIIRGDFDGLQSSLAQIWEKIKLHAATLWQAFSDTVKTIIQTFIEFAKHMFTLFKVSVNKIWTEVKDYAIETWTKLKEGVENAVKTLKENVTTWFVETKNNVVESAKALYDNVLNWFRTTKENAINYAKQTKENVVNWWNNLVETTIKKVIHMKDSVINWFRTTKENAVNSAIDLKNNVVKGFNQMVENVTTWIKELPKRVRQGFNDAIKAAGEFVSSAIKAGKDIISGFIKGVTQKASDLVSSVTGVIDSAIGGAKRLLGIKSPSRVFAYFGRMTDEGFGKGIKQHEGKAISPIENMLEKAKAVFGTEDLSFASNLDNLNARASATVDHVVTDNTQKNQPAVVYLQMGNQTYRAYVNDLTRTQEKTVKLEEVYL